MASFREVSLLLTDNILRDSAGPRSTIEKTRLNVVLQNFIHNKQYKFQLLESGSWRVGLPADFPFHLPFYSHHAPLHRDALKHSELVSLKLGRRPVGRLTDPAISPAPPTIVHNLCPAHLRTTLLDPSMAGHPVIGGHPSTSPTLFPMRTSTDVFRGASCCHVIGRLARRAATGSPAAWRSDLDRTGRGSAGPAAATGAGPSHATS